MDIPTFFKEWLVRNKNNNKQVIFNGNETYNTVWYSNGQIAKQSHFIHTMKQGVWYSWYENGQMMFEIHYQNNYLQGSYTEWNDDGKIMERGIYHKGSRQDYGMNTINWTT